MSSQSSSVTETPSVEEFICREVGERDWGTELLIAHTDAYIMKRLFMKAGKAGGLQHHVTKIETFFVESGEVFVDYDAGDGILTQERVGPGRSIHIPSGAPHRVTAITDAVLFEASTPVFNDRVRDEAKYGEPEVGGLPSTRT